MRGEDVAAVQAALGVEADGLYGPVTAGAAASWKHEAGYPATAVDGTLRPEEQRALLGLLELPPGYARRARARARDAAAAPAMRERATARLERWAARGVRERPLGSDRVPALQRLARRLGLADWYCGMGWPWCAFAVFLTALEAGGRTAELGLRRGAFNALYTPAILAEAQAARSGMRVVALSQAARGDLVLFDWSAGGDPVDHVGRLVRPPQNGVVATVDGNTSDLVAVRERRVDQVRAFVRDS
jgi:hypothetical protein